MFPAGGGSEFNSCFNKTFPFNGHIFNSGWPLNGNMQTPPSQAPFFPNLVQGGNSYDDGRDADEDNEYDEYDEEEYEDDAATQPGRELSAIPGPGRTVS